MRIYPLPSLNYGDQEFPVFTGLTVFTFNRMLQPLSQICCHRFISRYAKWKIYAQQFSFSIVSLKIKVFQLIIKHDCRNIFCVCMLGFYDNSFLSELWRFSNRIILYTQKFLKNLIIIRNLHTNKDNVITFKFHNTKVCSQ